MEDTLAVGICVQHTRSSCLECVGQFFGGLFRGIANQVSAESNVQRESAGIHALGYDGYNSLPHADNCAKFEKQIRSGRGPRVEQRHENTTATQSGFKRVAQGLTGPNIEFVEPDAYASML